MATNLAADPAGPIDAERADCIAPAMIDALGGPDAFETAGISPADLASADATLLSANGITGQPGAAVSLGTVALDCGLDLAGAVADLMGDDLSTSARACLADGFDADLIGRLLLDLPDADASVIDITLTCAHLLD